MQKASSEAIGKDAPAVFRSKDTLRFFNPPAGSAGSKRGQPFDEWVKEPHPQPWKNLGTKAKPMIRNAIYVLPIGDFNERAPSPDHLLLWCRAFFHGLRVETIMFPQAVCGNSPVSTL